MRILRWSVAAIVLALVILTLGRIDAAAVARSLGQAAAGPLLLAATSVVVPLWLRSLRAAYLLRAAGAPPVPFGRVAAVTVYGFSLSSLTPGGSGDLLRVAALRPHGVSARNAAAIVVFERAFDLVWVLGLLVVSLAVTLGSPAQARGVPVVLGLAVVAALALVAFVRPDPQRWVERLPLRVAALAPDPIASRALGRPQNLLATAGVTSLLVASEALRPWLVMQSLGLDVGIFGAWAVFTLAWLAGLLSMLPLGVGSWETAAIWAFGLYDVGPSEGAAAAVLLRVGVTLPALLAGGAALLVLRRTVFGEAPVEGAVPASRSASEASPGEDR